MVSGAGNNGRFSLGKLGGGFNSNKQPFDLLSVQSSSGMSPADALFAGPREKLLNKLKVFNDMKMNSVALPFNPKDEIHQANKDKYKHA